MRECHLSLAYSPCPNDTFLCSAIADGRVQQPGLTFDIHLHDIAALNQAAEAGRYDIVKLSFATWLRVAREYELLDTGAALGFGCGPLIISREPLKADQLSNCRVVLPGRRTTAHLLFNLLGIQPSSTAFLRYDDIIPALLSGAADCGVIIHESRFTYAQSGLHCVLDLGGWWEDQTGLPIPLGGFAMRRSLPVELRRNVEALMRASIVQARSRPVAEDRYILDHAREMDPSVLQRHIDLYVNDFTVTLGQEGRAAVDALANRARSLPEFTGIAA